MKVRLKLKAKKSNTAININKDDVIIRFNDVFDLDNGIAYYPIDKNMWDLVSYDVFTGIIDNDIQFYNNDKINASTNAEDGLDCILSGIIVFDDGAYCLDIKDIDGKDCGFDIGQKIPLYRFKTIELKNLDN